MLQHRISEWLNDYLHTAKLDTFIVGVSGGIDSAVVSTLCAITGIKTIVVSMPIHQAEDQLTRAKDHIVWLEKSFSNVKSVEIDLTETFEKFRSLFANDSKLALANSRSRIRMTTLYHIASQNNGIVVGTGNKVEDFGVGFFTKYGDGGVDISPIADLLKTEVWKLGKDLGISQSIIDAKPTDGLWEDDRNDEDQLGASYSELEWAMQFLEKNPYFSPSDLNLLTPREKEVIIIYKTFHSRNLHKMQSIPIFKK
jgi:NAD+ synthase